MSRRCTFTPEDNKTIIRLKAAGSSWTFIAGQLHRNRDRVREYALKSGLVQRMDRAQPGQPQYDYSRQPMPAFHPTSWGAIWEGLNTRP